MMRRLTVILFLLAPLISGCAFSPSLNFLGAFFPDWIFCMSGGLCAAIMARHILLREGLLEKAGPPLVIYPALVLIFSLVIWIVFFG